MGSRRALTPECEASLLCRLSSQLMFEALFRYMYVEGAFVHKLGGKFLLTRLLEFIMTQNIPKQHIDEDNTSPRVLHVAFSWRFCSSMKG